jgi:hypothetical protein
MSESKNTILSGGNYLYGEMLFHMLNPQIILTARLYDFTRARKFFSSPFVVVHRFPSFDVAFHHSTSTSIVRRRHPSIMSLISRFALPPASLTHSIAWTLLDFIDFLHSYLHVMHISGYILIIASCNINGYWHDSLGPPERSPDLFLSCPRLEKRPHTGPYMPISH